VNDPKRSSRNSQVVEHLMSVALIAFAVIAVAVLLQMQVEALIALTR
jgi:hypothetical protein